MNLLSIINQSTEKEFQTMEEVRDYFIKEEFLELYYHEDTEFYEIHQEITGKGLFPAKSPKVYKLLQNAPVRHWDTYYNLLKLKKAFSTIHTGNRDNGLILVGIKSKVKQQGRYKYYIDKNVLKEDIDINEIVNQVELKGKVNVALSQEEVKAIILSTVGYGEGYKLGTLTEKKCNILQTILDEKAKGITLLDGEEVSNLTHSTNSEVLKDGVPEHIKIIALSNLNLAIQSRNIKYLRDASYYIKEIRRVLTHILETNQRGI